MVDKTWRRLSSKLPRGKKLPERDWHDRHVAMIVILVAHVAGIFGYCLLSGRTFAAALLAVTPIGITAALSASPSLPRRARSSLAVFGAMLCSATIVQLSGGQVESHFHFFVMLAVVTMYQDWLPFLIAIGCVAAEHAIVGVLAPGAVYSHAEHAGHPLKWTLIHSLYISGAALAAIANWRLTEGAQAAERKIAEQLAYDAGHDPLTGALNRREFDRRLAEAMSRPGPPGTRDALCFLDLDRFKIVNDSCGHAAGDLLLVQVTSLIRDLLGERDLLARVGGDEFAVLLVDCDLDRAYEFAEAARTAVADHRFTSAGRVFGVGVSIGVVGLAATTAAHEALRSADAACYAAKDNGRNRVHMVALDGAGIARQRGEAEWAERLMTAINDDKLMLFYQPIAATAPTGAELFGELLLRLPAEDGTLAGPGAFLPAAERYDLVGAVDRWVVQAAFRTLAPRYATGLAEGRELFSINLSGGSIGDESFQSFVREQLAEHRIPANVICFEITETVAITDLSAATGFITELRALGCRFALDDFGSGLSSFAYLKRLPVDFVKIDGNFVRDITIDAVDRAMVESVNRIAHEMGLRTVAEFVETDAIMQSLCALGVDYVQGYGVAMPEPFTGWLARNPRTTRELAKTS